MPSTRRSFLGGILSGSLVMVTGCLDQVPEPDALDGTPTLDGSWAQPRYDPRNTAHVPEATGFDEPPGKYWFVEFEWEESRFTTSPVLDDERVFLPAQRGGSIYRFQADGEHDVFAELDGTSRLPLLAMEDAIYHPRKNQLVKIDSSTGEEVHRVDVPGTSMALPTVGENRVYAGLTGGGTSQWTFSIDLTRDVLGWGVETDLLWGPPAVADSTVFFGDSSGKLMAVETTPGTEHPDPLWIRDTEGDGVTSGVVADDESIYLQTAGTEAEPGYLLAYSHTGNERWRTEFEGRVGTSPALADGLLYVVDEDVKLHAFDATTGEQRWTFPDGIFSESSEGGTWHDHSPVVAGDTVLYVDGDDCLRALSSDGDELWQTSDDERVVWSPVIARDAIVYGGPTGVGVLGPR